MTKNNPRISDAASALGWPTLSVTWQGGETVTVNLAGWIATGGEMLSPLKDPQVFMTAVPIDFGAAVGWAGEDDLAIDARHLFKLAEEQRPFGPADASAWQNGMSWSNQETADFLGVALSTWNSYKAGAPVPVAVAMLCRAAQRDPLLAQAHYRPRQAGRPRKSA